MFGKVAFGIAVCANAAFALRTSDAAVEVHRLVSKQSSAVAVVDNATVYSTEEGQEFDGKWKKKRGGGGGRGKGKGSQRRGGKAKGRGKANGAGKAKGKKPPPAERIHIHEYLMASQAIYRQEGEDSHAMSDFGTLEEIGFLPFQYWTEDDDEQDTNGAELYVNFGECMLSFRSKEMYLEDAEKVPAAPVVFFGLEGVSSGLVSILYMLLAKMHPGGARELIQEKCDKKFVIVGHGVGGAVGALLAALINKKDNPLGWHRAVDAVYTFGALPLGTEALSDDSSEDGCFAGAAYFAIDKDSDLVRGTAYVDYSFRVPLGTAKIGSAPQSARLDSADDVISFKQPNMAKVFVEDLGVYSLTPCGVQSSNVHLPSKKNNIHDIATYHKRIVG